MTTSQLLENGRRHKSVVVALCFAVIGFLTIPNIARLPAAGLDNSWIIGLNMAVARGLQFGTDIVFTFGPLGFLWRPAVCYPKLWLIAAIVALAVHFLLIYLIVVVATKASAGLKEYLLLGVVMILALSRVDHDFKLMLSAAILLYLVMTEQLAGKRMCVAAIACASLLMATASLIKFMAAMISLSMFCAMIPLLIWKKQARYCVYALAAYVASFLSLWIVAGQRVRGIPAYVHNSLEIAGGYSAAMQIWDNTGYVYIGAFTAACWILLLVWALATKGMRLTTFVLLNLGIVAVAFKHGAVRSDDHVFSSLAHILLVYGVLAGVLNSRALGPRRFVTSIVLMCTALLVVAGLRVDYENLAWGISRNTSLNYWRGVKYCTLNGQAVVDNVKEDMRKQFALSDNTIRYIGGRPVDVFNSEIAIAYAYNLNWSPRPVFQSYSAYTAELDMLNARHLSSARAPEVLLHDLSVSIDDRNPAFDEPATFRAVMVQYDVRFEDGKYLVLERREHPIQFVERPVLVVNARAGEEVKVPKTGRDVYARIHADLTLTGQAARLLYKLPLMRIQIVRDSQTSTYRFITANAKNGIYVSPIESFSLYPASSLCYRASIPIEFFEAIPQNGDDKSTGK
jgi:hypothetical protein